jgi:hypothetical protein
VKRNACMRREDGRRGKIYKLCVSFINNKSDHYYKLVFASFTRKNKIIFFASKIKKEKKASTLKR